MSSSEVAAGGQIGKNSKPRPCWQAIVQTLLGRVELPRGIYLAVQGCEHLNRALVVKENWQIKRELEIVSVLPSMREVPDNSQLGTILRPCRSGISQLRLVWTSEILLLGMHVKHVQSTS